jgi:ubiquinol-cytochrome c reductase iron-sulfur subunit
VDLSGIAVGQRITVKWRGRPAFIVHRTPQEIEQAESVDLAELRDPQSDDERVQRKPWLIVVGVCTHAGCTPQGQRSGQLRGDWGGCRCTCHYSYYDTSGRIRRGPAPRNLEVPAYVFLDDNRLRIG